MLAFEGHRCNRRKRYGRYQALASDLRGQTRSVFINAVLEEAASAKSYQTKPSCEEAQENCVVWTKSSSSLVGQNERVLVVTNGPRHGFDISALVYDTSRRATIEACAWRSSDDNESFVLWQLEKLTFVTVLARHPGSQQSSERRQLLHREITGCLPSLMIVPRYTLIVSIFI